VRTWQSRHAKPHAFGDGSIFTEKYRATSSHRIPDTGRPARAASSTWASAIARFSAYQKLIEMHHPDSHASLRAEMGEAAIAIAKAVGYDNAGLSSSSSIRTAAITSWR
jgi:acetyl/propionyl-CoA carboxylase alpha subunit